jgi:hypothetical protein
VLCLTVGPVILAEKSAPPGYVFGGFLHNPIDGATYQAKMFQGWQGKWKYTPPYSPEPGPGAYLYVFYLLLGHVARISHSSIIGVFHFARALAIIILLFSLYHFAERMLPDPGSRGWAFVLSGLCTGMGWVTLPFGHLNSDFWVAEMYPFLSAYATPHFAFGLALMLYLLTPEANNDDRPVGFHHLLHALAALSLALVYPFGIVVALLGLSSALVWHLRCHRQHSRKFAVLLKSRAVLVLITGAPVLLYDYWVVRTNPQLTGWISQSVTPAPPLWDLVISLSPFLWLAIPGAVCVIRSGDSRRLTLVFWAVLALILIYLRISQPRRFTVGLFVPFVLLAVTALEPLARASVARARFYTTLIFALALPTNLILLAAGYYGIRTHDARLYMTADEVTAYQWLLSNTPADALILAAPQTGLLIPGQTGRRVLYGHPFESWRAESAEKATRHFYETGDTSTLRLYPIQYIFHGPREASLNPSLNLHNFRCVYSAGTVSIYSIAP